jgi:hypothetical protein
MIKKCTWERLAMERRSEICRLKAELQESESRIVNWRALGKKIKQLLMMVF